MMIKSLFTTMKKFLIAIGKETFLTIVACGQPVILLKNESFPRHFFRILIYVQKLYFPEKFQINTFDVYVMLI